MKRNFSGSRDEGSAKEVDDKQSDPSSRGGLFARLSRTREGLFGGVASLFRGATIDESVFEEIEDQLLVADAGIAVSRRLSSTFDRMSDGTGSTTRQRCDSASGRY